MSTEKNFVTATYRDVYEYLLASTCDFNLSDFEGRPKSTFSADSETPSQVYVSGNHGCMWHRLVAVRATTDRQTKPSLAFPLPGMRGQYVAQKHHKLLPTKSGLGQNNTIFNTRITCVNNDSLAAFQCLKPMHCSGGSVCRPFLASFDYTYDMFFLLMPQLNHQFFSLFVFSVKGQEIVNKNKPIALRDYL